MELNENSFDIMVNIEKNKLKCSIELKESMDEQVEYAFYLLLDKKRIDTKYYTSSDSVEFDLTCDGIYNIVGFVRCGEQMAIRTSNEVSFVFNTNHVNELNSNKTEPIPISIFGSCVSRDVLEFDYARKISLKTYVARQSVVSSVSNPIECNIDDINLKSNFQKEAVYHDFVKDTFERFKNDGSSHLIIDLIDERFKLSAYEKNGVKSIVTYSALLQESAYLQDLNFIYPKRNMLSGKKYYIQNTDIDIYLNDFAKKILSIYKAENIVIHKAKMCNYYINSMGEIKAFPLNHLKNNKDVNALLDYMYDYLESAFDGCQVIDILDEFSASESHKWGLAPMHYEDGYYRKMIGELIKILQEDM
jgi:hypothetical protein